MAASVSLDRCAATPGRSDGPSASPPADQTDESGLIAAALDGDHEAFVRLYDLHAARVYRHCLSSVGTGADAEALTQQTFFHAWRAIRRFPPSGQSFVGWLLTISQNLAASRAVQARPREASPATLTPRLTTGALAEAIIADIRRDRMRRAIMRLAPEPRRVIVLRFVEDFTVAEAAAALGKSEGNVRAIQRRALDDLRRLLGELEAAPAPVGVEPADRFRRVVAALQRRLGAP
jgi:RNA polymerase sigma-70 factor (ECF subfamily)